MCSENIASYGEAVHVKLYCAGMELGRIACVTLGQVCVILVHSSAVIAVYLE